MVIFELKEARKDRLIYLYYPENRRNKKPGIIEVDRYDNSIKVTEVAEGDGAVNVNYGGHAMVKIMEGLEKGEVLKKGGAYWY